MDKKLFSTCGVEKREVYFFYNFKNRYIYNGKIHIHICYFHKSKFSLIFLLFFLITISLCIFSLIAEITGLFGQLNLPKNYTIISQLQTHETHPCILYNLMLCPHVDKPYLYLSPEFLLVSTFIMFGDRGRENCVFFLSASSHQQHYTICIFYLQK